MNLEGMEATIQNGRIYFDMIAQCKGMSMKDRILNKLRPVVTAPIADLLPLGPPAEVLEALASLVSEDRIRVQGLEVSLVRRTEEMPSDLAARMMTVLAMPPGMSPEQILERCRQMAGDHLRLRIRGDQLHMMKTRLEKAEHDRDRFRRRISLAQEALTKDLEEGRKK